MFTFAVDFGPWKGVKYEKGKNLFVIHFTWMSLWFLNTSLVDAINKLRNKPVAPKDKSNKHLLN